MAVLLELFIIVLIEYAFTVPGAIAKWAYFKIMGKETTLKACLTEGIMINYLVSIGFLLAITGAITLI